MYLGTFNAVLRGMQNPTATPACPASTRPRRRDGRVDHAIRAARAARSALERSAHGTTIQG